MVSVTAVEVRAPELLTDTTVRLSDCIQHPAAGDSDLNSPNFPRHDLLFTASFGLFGSSVPLLSQILYLSFCRSAFFRRNQNILGEECILGETEEISQLHLFHSLSRSWTAARSVDSDTGDGAL